MSNNDLEQNNVLEDNILHEYEEEFSSGWASFYIHNRYLQFGADCAWSLGVSQMNALGEEEIDVEIGGTEKECEGVHALAWCKLYGLGASILSGLFDEDQQILLEIAREMRKERKKFTALEIRERLLANGRDEI